MSEDTKGSAEYQHGSFGKFIQAYSGFLSSFVIGAAGLVATSIWQYRQANVAQKQADSQEQVAHTQAENSWKIEKADILSKNLQSLSGTGPANVEQRYGILLSLTRGDILDPELAVSYALELGKDNPDYMRTVLVNTAGKDYWRLARAFEPTCAQKYGVARQVAVCTNDKLAGRSAAVAEMIADEVQGAFASGKPGPLAMLKDETAVQNQATRLAWLFTPALMGFYDRRQFREISQFESSSGGARLVTALILSGAGTEEFVANDEASRLEAFHTDRRKWLTQYLFGSTCDAECRGRLIEFMLSVYAEARGLYDPTFIALLEKPMSQSGPAISRLHTRLLWCQVDDDDLAQLRDNVLRPAMVDLLKADGKEKERLQLVESVVGLLALVPEPSEEPALTPWKQMLLTLQSSHGGRYAKLFSQRRAIAQKERQSPPPTMKKMAFCNAPLTDPNANPDSP